VKTPAWWNVDNPKNLQSVDDAVRGMVLHRRQYMMGVPYLASPALSADDIEDIIMDNISHRFDCACGL